MSETIQVTSLPPDEAVVEGVHKIANALNRKRGYAISIPITDVRTVLEATHMLVERARDNIEENNTVSEKENKQ